jgi:hypothetical protein
MLKHLYSLPKLEDSVMIYGTTERYRTKFVTTVYYKPMTSEFTPPHNPSMGRRSAAVLLIGLSLASPACGDDPSSAEAVDPFRYTYDFEGGRDGAAITTVDDGSGRPFDTVYESHPSSDARYEARGFVADGEVGGRFTYDAPDDPFSAVGWDLPAGAEFYLRAIGRIDGSHSGGGYGFENDALDNNLFVAVDSGKSPYIAGQGLEHLAEAETFFENGDVFRAPWPGSPRPCSCWARAARWGCTCA